MSSGAFERDREMRNALQRAGVGVWRWDTRSNRIEWDDCLHALFGLPPDTFHGSAEDALALIHPDDRDKMREMLAAVPEQGARVVDHRVILPDGRVRWVTASLSFLGENRTEGVYTGVAWDSTERHQMLESLEATRLHLEHAHRIARVATWSWSQEEGMRWSPSMYELYQVPQGSAQSAEDHLMRLHSDDRERVRREYVDALKSCEPYFKHEFRVCLPDGQMLNIRSMFHIEREASCRARAVVGVVQDITDQVRAREERLALEAQLNQTQRLESLGVLASGIAHDFNNILLAIGGNAQLALADCPSDDPLRFSLLEIEKARVRASELVRRILAFSRPAALDQRPLDLADTINEAVKLLRAALPAMIELRLQVHSPLPIVNADPGQIHQVVMNLVTNAAQALGEKGGLIEVVVRQRELPDSTGAPGRCLSLSVRDNGPGMDAATRARMFEPFFTTRKRGGGAGLGLAVVHGIVQAHRGQITVDTGPGSGARITVLLPASAENVHSTKPSIAAEPLEAPPDAAQDSARRDPARR